MAQAAAAAVDYAAVYSRGMAGASAARTRAGAYAPDGAGGAYAAERPAVRVRESARTRTRYAAGISPFSILGFATVAVLMVFVILAHVSVNAASKEAAEMEARLESLAQDERRLKISYENAFDTSEIEAYAVNALGMIPASAGATGIISIAPADKAEIIGTGAAAESGFIDNMADFILSLLEYFK
ncbi:MAG: hypothetical protein LBJ84_04230 [Oscillospiraceae bacterium]|jgi:hypothetical protein|nr:hypothetical protein [Oscillospiraceae bacterium]